MKKLVAKEIRLVLPVFGVALLLASLPAWLLPHGADGDSLATIALYPFSFGAVLLAIASFGRESSLNTFQLLLAQPLERAMVWRTKITVLLPAMITIFTVWYVSCLARSPEAPERAIHPLVIQEGGIIALAAVSGGLWTTLLLRQAAAPFWFTILLPATLATVVSVCGGAENAIFIALALYSIAGVFFARTLFFNAQEIAWTGGTIVLPGLQSRAVQSQIRRRRPWLAMIRAELHLHQIVLASMLVLFAVHMGTLLFQHSANEAFVKSARAVSDLCGLLWYLMPLMIGATSIAEERKLGTMEGRLCLPVSARRQFVFKLLLAVLVGGVLSATLFCVKSYLGHTMPSPFDFSGSKEVPSTAGFFAGLLGMSVLFSIIATLAFYASTLSRNFIQGLMTGIIVVILAFGLFIGAIAFGLNGYFRLLPWRPPLVYVIGIPVFFAALFRLALGNFRRLPETWRLWRRNLVGIACAFLFTATATAALYNRAWELLTPLEPEHGPSRISAGKPAQLRRDGGSLLVLLPDGRLWQTRFLFEYSSGFLSKSFGYREKWKSLEGNHFVEGSNWVDAAEVFQKTVAIRQDGTLWMSEKPRPILVTVRIFDQPVDVVPDTNRFLPDAPDTLIQCGNDSTWKKLAPVNSVGGLILSKIDGTLWHGLPPTRFGLKSNWSEIMSVSISQNWGSQVDYFWDADGQASSGLPNYFALERQQRLDGTRWRCITEWASRWIPFHAGVRADGTIWVWNTVAVTLNGRPPEKRISQIGRDSDWLSVAASARSLVGLKTDGTLWIWKPDSRQNGPSYEWPVTEPAVRLGTHNDWVAICGAAPDMCGIITLAADGSLWWWRITDPGVWSGDSFLIAPSKKPVKLGNIFGQG